ncbi:TonB-dependent receptor [Granulicella sp. WH15]|uniref:TonB-dependent receptor n=1 Tax=Granulicella sp. WH15 TaxID=2602070 RepID=UPI0013A5A1F2|nr:TonB-dependent receptor [Granulicella sp. WH15]
MQRVSRNPVSISAPARTVFILAVLLFAACEAQAKSPRPANVAGATVQGVVRDAEGVAQMGALVQVLSGNATVGKAFTDPNGHYVIALAELLPRRYSVRASATLFIPATRENLQLKTGSRTVVNLTLATLFETTSWLPSDRRRPDEPADDWKWTLRSTANRPILRVLDDGETVLLSAGDGEAEGPRRGQIQARATVEGGSGGFGNSGVRTTLEANRELPAGADLLMQAQLGSAFGEDSRGAATEVATGYQRRSSFGTSRTIVRYASHPELVAGGVAGVQTVDIRSAQLTQMGDMAELEVGGSLRAVHAGSDAFQAAPFVRLTAHPSGTWMVQYRMASARDVQGIADMDAADDDIPVAIVANGKLRLEQGRHHELSVAHKMGRGTVEVTVYHDSLDNAHVAGVGAGLVDAALASPGLDAMPGAMVDTANGSFEALAGGYSGAGASVELDETLMPGLVGALEYTMGKALAANSAAASTFEGSVAAMKARSAESATVALRGKIGSTRVRASYRWQPVRTLTSVNPYGNPRDEGYLSFTVRQPVRWGNHLPQGLDATIDVTNLLAQGYRPFVSADGQTLYFAQAPRTLQAGLSFSF